MKSSGDGDERVAVAVLDDSARALPSSADQLFRLPGVGETVPVEDDDVKVVVAATEEGRMSRVQLN